MFLCGIDEAGRGPLAGPVCAAAVILPEGYASNILNDSKKMNASSRECARGIICLEATAWGLGWASASEIDEINIHNATLLAMKRAFFAAQTGADQRKTLGATFAAGKIRAVVDGRFAPDIPISCEAMIKADSKVPAVMAASIMAKTARDRLMEYYSIFYPQYGYERHKGYPTKAHREAIHRYGPSPIQRKSFNVLLD